jgi:riboflavin synthase
VFTGLVEGMGELRANRPAPGGRRLEVDMGPLAQGVRTGDSVCVHGVCLTVAGLAGPVAAFDLSGETLDRSCFAGMEVGRKVNLERSLRLGDRLGGHFLTGHVDGTGRLREASPAGGFAEHRFAAPAGLLPLLVEKGSVGVDGVSLTVSCLHDDGFSVALIPETLARTTLGALRPGEPVHLEADLLAKHVARLLAARAEPRSV